MVPHPDNAPVVRQAFIMAKEGHTRAAIRDYLRMATDEHWTTTRVTNLLRNEAYIGVLQFGDWRNESAHEPLVDRPLWDAVFALLDTPPARPPRKPKASIEDTYRYYLRGRVRCPHCVDDKGQGVPYTQASAGKNHTHYYVCLRDNKREGTCQVGRVNADALHYTVLSQIERAARHQTVMHRLIAESGGWQSAPEDLHRFRGELGKKMQFIGAARENLLRALERGRASDTLLNRLDTLEADEREIKEKIVSVDQDIEKATLDRPTASTVMESWGSVLDIWPDLEEDEKAAVLSSLVEEVTIISKDRVGLRLSAIAELHGHLLAINSQMGALRRSRSIKPRSVRSLLRTLPAKRGPKVIV
jgi:hypothetical protein